LRWRQLAGAEIAWYGRRVGRADRRRAGRSTATKPKTAAAPASASPSRLLALGESTASWSRVAFAVLALVLVVSLWRTIEARITWYLAVDQFGYLQFAHDLLQGKVFHEWEPARLLGILPKRTDILSQTYIWDDGRMYCRYSPGFPMLVAGWIGLFGDDRVSFLNPTIYLALLGMAIACAWRLTGSVWRGLVVAVLIALCPTQMYWWATTLTRDLSAHLFAFVGLYHLIPRSGQPLDVRRAVVGGLALGFAATIRNDAVLYLVPGTLLVGYGWLRERPEVRRLVSLAGLATAGLVLGLLPTLAYNAVTTGNPFRPTQGMEIEKFLPDSPEGPAPGGARVGYPPEARRSGLWKGTAFTPVSGGGLRLRNFPKVAPLEWALVFKAYGWKLIILAGLGAVMAAVHRPALFLFALPYTVIAFCFYSCWSKPDARYIIGIFSMVPFLVAEGVFGTLDVVREIAKRRGEELARPIAIGVAVAAVLVAIVPMTPAPPTADATLLSKGVLPLLSVVLPMALALGALVHAWQPARRVSDALAPALAVLLVVFAVQRADATRKIRAPFQGPQAALARATMRQTLEPRSVVITSEDIGRPAENIEHYAGFPSIYLTDLTRWRLTASQVVVPLISAGVRPYLLVDRDVPERAAFLADLTAKGYVAERIADIPVKRKMEYFVAAPVPRESAAELFRISHPEWEELLRSRKIPGRTG
jgi:hypothetical protein